MMNFASLVYACHCVAYAIFRFDNITRYHIININLLVANLESFCNLLNSFYFEPLDSVLFGIATLCLL